MSLAIPFALALGLMLAAAGASSGPDDGPEPPDLDPNPPPRPGPGPDDGEDEDPWDGLIPPPDDEDMLDGLTDEDIFDAACAIWGARTPGESDSSLALRALRGLFPGLVWPGTPGGQRAEAQQRVQAVFADIRGGLISCDGPIEIEPEPRAGGFYQIKQNDNLFGIVQHAYPGLTAQQRVQAARTVINSPKNGAGKIGSGIIVATTQQGNKNLLGDAIVSFYPKWTCQPATEHARYESGNCYAVVYLPVI